MRVAILDRARLHPGRVCAGCFLGHRVADALLAIEERLEELLLLVICTVSEQRQHSRVIGSLAVHRQRAEVARAKLHLHQRVGKRAEPHSSMFLRNKGQPQTLRAGLGPQPCEQLLKIAALLELLFSRNAFIMHPLADFFADGLCFGGNLEIDGHLELLMCAQRHKNAARHNP